MQSRDVRLSNVLHDHCRNKETLEIMQYWEEYAINQIDLSYGIIHLPLNYFLCCKFLSAASNRSMLNVEILGLSIKICYIVISLLDVINNGITNFSPV